MGVPKKNNLMLISFFISGYHEDLSISSHIIFENFGDLRGCSKPSPDTTTTASTPPTTATPTTAPSRRPVISRWSHKNKKIHWSLLCQLGKNLHSNFRSGVNPIKLWLSKTYKDKVPYFSYFTKSAGWISKCFTTYFWSKDEQL